MSKSMGNPTTPSELVSASFRGSMEEEDDANCRLEHDAGVLGRRTKVAGGVGPSLAVDAPFERLQREYPSARVESDLRDEARRRQEVRRAVEE